MLFLNRPTRCVYLILVVFTGLLFFLYAAYTASYDGNVYRAGPLSMSKNISGNSILSRDKTMVEVNLTSPRPMDKNETSVKLKEVSVEIAKKILSSSTSSTSSPAPPPQQKAAAAPEKEKKSVIQKIGSKPTNSSQDYINQGVKTRSVYDAGFNLPNIEICPDFGKNLQVAILVTSAPKHAEARMSIRQTWGHYQQRSDVIISFLLGKTVEPGLQADIEKESKLYNDIIQGNFYDSYSNLTLKSVAMLEWVDNYCFHAKFVLKTDDDMFINIPKLLSFINKHSKDKKRIYGRLARKWKPIRNKVSKYYVSVQQYRNPIFPDFTTGPAYLMTGDIIHNLYITALEKTYLKLEDVYTTGIVAQENKVQRVHVNEFFNKRVTFNPCNIQNSISIHMVKSFEQYDLWKKLLDGRSKC